MNADEYERRLRDAVISRAEHLSHRGDMSCCREPFRTAGFYADLDAYADWLRLRAVAGQPCWRHAQYSWDGKWHTERRADCVSTYPDGSPIEPAKICEPHQAQQQIAEILAAEGGTE